MSYRPEQSDDNIDGFNGNFAYDPAFASSILVQENLTGDH